MNEKDNFESLHNAIVAKRHQTVESLSKLTLTELRFLNFCLAQIDTRQDANRQVKTNIKALKAIYPSMDQKTAYGIVKRTWTGMNSKPLEVLEPIEGSKDRFEVVGYAWIEEVRYAPDTQDFRFKITKGAVPYLLGIKEKFSKYRLRDVSKFSSRTTWMLFEYLETLWEYQNSWRIELDELKTKLGIPGKYPRWAAFQRAVIIPAVDEINTNTELSVTYEKEKRGRAVFALVFFVEKKAPEGTIDIESDLDRAHALKQTLLRANISKTQAQAIVKDAEKFGKIDESIQLVNALIEGYGKLEKKPCALPKYVMGSVSDTLRQQQLFSPKTADTPAENIMDHIPEQWRSHHDVLRDIAAYTKTHGEAYVMKNVVYSVAKNPTDFAAYLGHALKQNYGAGYNPGPVEKPGPVIEPGMVVVYQGQEYTVDNALCIYPESGGCMPGGQIVQKIKEGEIEIKMDE